MSIDLEKIVAIDTHAHIEEDGHGCFSLDQELLDASAKYFSAEADRTPTFKVESLLSLLSEDEIARWDATKRAVFGAAMQARHRASADAKLLQETVVRVHESPEVARRP